MHDIKDRQNLVIRHLWAPDLAAIRDHFLRLDPPTRRSRFGNTISDSAVRDYASHVVGFDSEVCGAFIDQELRAVAELRRQIAAWPATAEIALSVEPEWQNAGLGDLLLTRLITIARNRGIQEMYLICARENTAMRHLAQKHNASFEVSEDMVQATLSAPKPTVISLASEFAGEAQGLIGTWQRFLHGTP